MVKFVEPNDANQRLVIALGDPAGIGMEVTLRALAAQRCPAAMEPVLVGCRQSLNATFTRLKAQGDGALADPDTLQIVDLPLQTSVQPGEPTPEGSDASFCWLSTAATLVLQGKARALVTAPIAKHLWHAAGHVYPGQTERLAEIGGVPEASMLFTAISPHTGWRLNTLLATTHIPLTDVARALNPDLIQRKLDTLADFCRRFRRRPVVHVAGVNPHAGENGQLGQEECLWLQPTLEAWAAENADVTVVGPLPPDTCWLSAGQAWHRQVDGSSPDGYLALYHDQGLIPVKLLAFDEAVNTSLGLPFLRTSPDHGTAFDVAGRGCARETSMVAAIQAAWDLSAVALNRA